MPRNLADVANDGRVVIMSVLGFCLALGLPKGCTGGGT